MNKRTNNPFDKTFIRFLPDFCLNPQPLPHQSQQRRCWSGKEMPHYQKLALLRDVLLTLLHDFMAFPFTVNRHVYRVLAEKNGFAGLSPMSARKSNKILYRGSTRMTLFGWRSACWRRKPGSRGIAFGFERLMREDGQSACTSGLRRLTTDHFREGKTFQVSSKTKR
jgi:hypothetical protein